MNVDRLKALADERKRLDALLEYRKALFDALGHGPGGYVGAGNDRSAFCTPVESVIVAVNDMINMLQRDVGSGGTRRGE